jgi:Spy/CpxP family protein refolding chaperone
VQRFVALAFTVLAASPLAAQPVGPQHQHGAASPPRPAPTAAASAELPRPYADLARRRVKALSDEQAAGLLAGRGLSLALAAELNGYPGPMHVLEHAAALGLTPEQRARAEELRRDMEGEARAIGARIVASEEELDALFARGEADAGRLASLTAALGALGGRLREAHLAAHIGMREALSPDQRAAYARLRGYTSG